MVLRVPDAAVPMAAIMTEVNMRQLFEIEYVREKYIGAYPSTDGIMANLYQRNSRGRRKIRGFYSLYGDWRPDDFLSIWPSLNDDISATLRLFAPVVIRQARDYVSKLGLAERLKKL
jgi:hypothetical protein